MIKFTVSGNESNVQQMLQRVLNDAIFKIKVKYYNGEEFEGGICSFKYNHPMTSLPPITELSLYIEDKIQHLDINQIEYIYGAQ